MKTKLQMMIFSEKKFNPKKIRNWIKKHDTKMLGYQKKPVKKYDEEYRVRIRERKFFKIDSLNDENKEYVASGVWAQYGELL